MLLARPVARNTAKAKTTAPISEGADELFYMLPERPLPLSWFVPVDSEPDQRRRCPICYLFAKFP